MFTAKRIEALVGGMVDAHDVVATAVIPRIVVLYAPLLLPVPGDRPTAPPR
ncbi:hypothetical protein [Micromonospora sp. 15K316]|uniref:hypothetical protein n=1 Tax=Micromonospora sp. 15K316 TaxID=2530376 RepID=UPI001FB83517|nr:hypothetical protein [Micromonospora sp. 15K316]